MPKKRRKAGFLCESRADLSVCRRFLCAEILSVWRGDGIFFAPAIFPDGLPMAGNGLRKKENDFSDSFSLFALFPRTRFRCSGKVASAFRRLPPSASWTDDGISSDFARGKEAPDTFFLPDAFFRENRTFSYGRRIRFRFPKRLPSALPGCRLTDKSLRRV